MGKRSPGYTDNAFVRTASLHALGQATIGAVDGRFNLTTSGDFVGTWELRRSFDGGETWQNVAVTPGTPNSFTTLFSTSLEEFEEWVYYAIAVTIYTSGVLNARISK